MVMVMMSMFCSISYFFKLCVRVCVRVYVQACVHECVLVRACVSVCVHVCVCRQGGRVDMHRIKNILMLKRVFQLLAPLHYKFFIATWQ